MFRVILACLFASIAVPSWAQAAAAVTYAVTMPEPEHHWLRIEATFPDLGSAPLHARMSRSSPGRYSVHEFVKNIFRLDAFDGTGRPLAVSRPNADGWDVVGHDGTVRIVYTIFGDRADGTYFGVDTTHAHLNMPAVFLWAEGLDMRPIRITFAPPPGAAWTVGTQLYGTADPFAFTAPNLQYFMDSPTEIARLVTSPFSVPNPRGGTATFRVVAHGGGQQADVDALAGSIARLVREEMAVFGEFPIYEPGAYTFLLDFVPWGEGDGMEHRNSTSISLPGISLTSAAGRAAALEVIAHEFFHNWNVERIRPAGIEPFDLTRENVTCCLWLGEGFTQYYGPLSLVRAGLSPVPADILAAPGAVIAGPGRQVRSAVQMSEQAPFWDMGLANDVTDQARTFISYYTYGEAIALGLDFTLREISAGRITLDDYMRRLWQRYGAEPDPRPGYVTRPYTLKDLREELGDLTGNRLFADDFFDRYIEGREVVDYPHLLSLAGYAVRPLAPGRAWPGQLVMAESAGGLAVGAMRNGGEPQVVPFGSPAYEAGLDEGDTVVSIDGRPATLGLWSGLAQRSPGEPVPMVVRRRGGEMVATTLTLEADPRVQVVPIESTGAALTAAQRAFRTAWLATHAP